MMDFTKLSNKKQIAFYCALSERILIKYINKHTSEVSNALISCRKLLIGEVISGDQLYNLLDDENFGISIFSEEYDNKIPENAWNCIIDTIAFSSRKAYELEGAKYFPEPIELVDDDLIIHFIQCYNELFQDNFAEDVFNYLKSQDDCYSCNWLNEIITNFRSVDEREKYE